MIIFDLQCQNGHAFEGWFEDSQAFEEQKRQGLIACPVCNDTSVVKVPSTFAIKGASQDLKPSASQKMDYRKLGRQIAEYVKHNFDDVGTDFAKEALKIHYGVSQPRNIRGVSTMEEEETLKEEGIEFFKLPMVSSSDPDPDPESN
ncbi:MAG: DUF1178 family protein [Desulfobacteraceae bacterium]|jgi:hypothetical protein